MKTVAFLLLAVSVHAQAPIFGNMATMTTLHTNTTYAVLLHYPGWTNRTSGEEIKFIAHRVGTRDVTGHMSTVTAALYDCARIPPNSATTPTLGR